MGKFIDLTGQRFGKLKVISPSHKDKQGAWCWNCECDCGNKINTIRGYSLIRGDSTSCGCEVGKKSKDITGKRFGRLVAVAPVSQSKNGVWKWLCKCDCGNEKIVSIGNLTSGSTRSCGCFRKENAIKNGLKSTTHGLSYTSLPQVRSNMLKRCYTKNSKDYHRYGGRGITVCDEWRQSPSVFYKWAVSSGFEEGLRIERIDNNGNYCPENCKWITHQEQQNNRENNHTLTFNGKTQTMAQWSRETGILRPTIDDRFRRGWTIEEALTTPTGEKRKISQKKE